MNKDIQAYNKSQTTAEKEICNVLATQIDESLPKAERKIWHRQPVWFLEGNPVVATAN
ncbi:MAG: hypothetical protein WDM90_19750 [Ferruginibacter sp.]